MTMKTLIIISMLLLTGCTREYFVFVYVQPEKKPAFGESILPTYDKSCGDPGCCVIHYDYQRIDTASFIFRLNRGDFCDSSGVLDVPQGGLGLHIRTRDTTDIGDRGDIRMDCTDCKTWTVDVDQIIKQYKTDSTLFSTP